MTDNEIIKALEYCITNDCAKCKAYDETNGEIVDCLHAICRNALDLINRQKAEIERLQNESIGKCELAMSIRSDHSIDVDCSYCIEQAKAEAIKEFAEKVKKKSWIGMWETVAHVDVDEIENLVKEMTE